MSQDAVNDLANPGVLRAAINMGNSLLVTGETPGGDPDGVSPDMARTLAERLGVAVELKRYPLPGDVADAAPKDEWDICLIAEEAKRAEVISFCQPYVEIEATYLVPGDSPFQKIEDVDQPGVKIAICDRAAYDLYLERILQHAERVAAPGLPQAFELYRNENLDALAGLVPALKKNAAEAPGSRLLPGKYMAVQQAMGTRLGKDALNAFVNAFLTEAKTSGLVQSLIDKHGVTGKLSVAD